MRTIAFHRNSVRTPRSALTLTTIGSHVVAILTFIFVQVFLVGRVDESLLTFAVVEFIVAGVIAVGWRWAPALGAALHSFMIVGNLEPLLYELAHPENTAQFGVMTVLTASAIAGTVTGALATIQNYRVPVTERHAPRWLRGFLLTLTALCAGAILVAAIPRETGAAVSPEVLAELPAVTIADYYNDGVIRVKAGQLAALRLENTDAVGHSFDVDELNVHVAMPGNTDSLALFVAPETPGEYRFYCAPHYDKATGSGMKGILIVEP